MADIAAIFHWRPCDMADMELEELLFWREAAVQRWNDMHRETPR